MVVRVHKRVQYESQNTTLPKGSGHSTEKLLNIWYGSSVYLEYWIHHPINISAGINKNIIVAAEPGRVMTSPMVTSAVPQGTESMQRLKKNKE